MGPNRAELRPRPGCWTTVAVARPYPGRGFRRGRPRCWRGLTHQLLVRTCVRWGGLSDQTVSRQSIEPSIPRGRALIRHRCSTSGVGPAGVAGAGTAGDHNRSGAAHPWKAPGSMAAAKKHGEQRGGQPLIRSGSTNRETGEGDSGQRDSAVGRLQQWGRLCKVPDHTPVGLGPDEQGPDLAADQNRADALI